MFKSHWTTLSVQLSHEYKRKESKVASEYPIENISFKKVTKFKRTFFFSRNKGDSDAGDIVMLVTLWWWPIWDVGGRIITLANRAPISQTCH